MESSELDFISGNLFNLPNFYKRSRPFEWSTRQVTREEKSINDKIEQVNIITDINRAQGVLSTNNQNLPFDRIEIAFDINTFQGNLAQRFDDNDVIPFLFESFSIANVIESELAGAFYG